MWAWKGMPAALNAYGFDCTAKGSSTVYHREDSVLHVLCTCVAGGVRRSAGHPEVRFVTVRRQVQFLLLPRVEHGPVITHTCTAERKLIWLC